jgi:hypothetical protein
MGIATYVLRLAARNTPSGSPRFLALPVLTLPFNCAKSCLLRRRPPTFDDEARAVRAIASVSLSVAVCSKLPTSFGWPATLEAKAPDAVGFYCIIAAATVVGLALGYTPIDPIQMLIWSAVLNGIVAVPIMTIMMVVVTRLSVMGRFSARPTLTFFGWAGTALMALTVVALFWSSFG